MTEADRHDDAGFDAMLRDLGPEVPMPELDAEARARLLGAIEFGRGTAPAGPGRRRFPWTAAGMGLAAMLGIACVFLFVDLGRARAELMTSHWETDEALTLLMKARASQATIPVPDDLGDTRSADLVLFTFDHDLCPIARVCTPAFDLLARTHEDGAARFIAFDVTGEKREQVDREIDALDMRFALLAPLGAETGVVKVVDTRHRRVLSSAPGQQGLEQAERLLTRISDNERVP